MSAPYMGKTSETNFRTKKKVSITKPEYTDDVQLKHKKHVKIINFQSVRLSEEREAKRAMLTQAVEDGNEPEEPINLDVLENKIDKATYKDSIDPEIYLTDTKKTEYDIEWRTHREGTSRL